VEATAGAEDSTAAADFMEVAEEGFTAVVDSTAEVILGSAPDTPTAYIVEEALEGGAITEVAAGTVGAEDIGDEGTATDGAGGLAFGGRIGVGDGDIRMALTTALGTTRLALIILTRTTVLRTIPRAILILTTGTAILHRQIPTHGPCPTRTDPQDPGDHRYREAHPTRATQTRFSPLTG